MDGSVQHFFDGFMMLSRSGRLCRACPALGGLQESVIAVSQARAIVALLFTLKDQSMKFSVAVSLLGVALLAGCATGPAAPAGMQAGKFVSYACEGGKRFQARLAADGSSVRIRHEGGYELDRKGEGVYEGEGWKLLTQGAVEVLHNGKTVLRQCRVS